MDGQETVPPSVVVAACEVLGAVRLGTVGGEEQHDMVHTVAVVVAIELCLHLGEPVCDGLTGREGVFGLREIATADGNDASELEDYGDSGVSETPTLDTDIDKADILRGDDGIGEDVDNNIAERHGLEGYEAVVHG